MEISLLNVIISLGSVLVRKAFEKSGERIADALFDNSEKFMVLLKTNSPDIATAIEAPNIDSGQYKQLTEQLQSAIKANQELQQAAELLVPNFCPN